MKNKKRKRGRCFRFAFGFLKKFPQRAVYCSSPLSAVFKPINLIISDQTRKKHRSKAKRSRKTVEESGREKEVGKSIITSRIGS